MRILIYDEDAVFALFLQEYLMDDGHEVFISRSSEESIKIIETQNLDFAILGITINCQSPKDIAKKLKSRDINFIYTSSDDPRVIRFAVPQAPLLLKPLEIETLRQRLRCRDARGPDILNCCA